MNLKRVLFGEPVPDKDDPRFKARYEREFEAGRRFGDSMGVGKFAGWLQRTAGAHKKLFLVIVFGIVVGCFGYNVYWLIRAYQYNQRSCRKTAVELQDSALSNIIETRKKARP